MVERPSPQIVLRWSRSQEVFFRRSRAASLVLGGLDQVVDVDVEVVIKLDEVDGGFGLHLVDDHPRPLPAVLFGVLHLFAHQTIDDLARFSLRRRVVCGGDNRNEVKRRRDQISLKQRV